MADTNRQAALRLARSGLLVFPLAPGAKVPLIPKREGGNGVHDATSNLTQITAWWSQWPDANIGVRTGVTFDALDIDGQAGLDSLWELRRAAGRTDHLYGPLVKTPGGFHWYVAPTAFGNRAGFRPGLDFRGRDGYVVAPPSVVSDGYIWAPQGHTWRARPRPAPVWLLDALGEREREPQGPTTPIASMSAYLAGAVRRQVQRIESAPRGTRNNTLNAGAWSLGRLIGHGSEHEDAVRDALVSAGERSGLSVHEVMRTVDHALADGMSNPIERSLPA